MTPRNPCPGGGRNAGEPGAVTGYNRVRVECGHCHELVEAWTPRVGEDMDPKALAAFGKAILEARLVHAIMECKALADA